MKKVLRILYGTVLVVGFLFFFLFFMALCYIGTFVTPQ